MQQIEINRRRVMGAGGTPLINPLIFTVNEGSPSGTITLTIPRGLTQEECTNIKYSLNGKTWVTFKNNGVGLTITTPTLNAGDSVYFIGQANLISKSMSVYSKFTTSSSTFKISASGSIMSLIGDSKTLTNYAFYKLFENCTSLTTTPELPATTLASNCYYGMFYGCTSLVNAPALPATTLASNCYQAIFSGCTSLTGAPALPATTLASDCYTGMFSNCTSLTTTPELPATTLADYCYDGMFSGCTSLVNAPELPATTLASNCYYDMFQDCTNLVAAPALPATTLASRCYSRMFYGCNNLSKITMLATNIKASYCLSEWVLGVAATGTFVKNPAMTTLPTGKSGIPSGWTIEDYAG